MNKEIISGDRNLTIQEAVKIMVEKESSYILVLDKGKPVGIVTEDDLIKKVLAADRDPKNTRLYEIMSTPLKTIDPDAPLSE
ncbi:MAG: cyclic nucleotide-binding/CBS domain-containing protein, partial [Endomicrobiia bacterium]